MGAATDHRGRGRRSGYGGGWGPRWQGLGVVGWTPRPRPRRRHATQWRSFGSAVRRGGGTAPRNKAASRIPTQPYGENPPNLRVLRWAHDLS